MKTAFFFVSFINQNKKDVLSALAKQDYDLKVILFRLIFTTCFDTY